MRKKESKKDVRINVNLQNSERKEDSDFPEGQEEDQISLTSKYQKIRIRQTPLF